jgi:hypothetical protein
MYKESGSYDERVQNERNAKEKHQSWQHHYKRHGETDEDDTARINPARFTFYQLKGVCSSTKLSRDTRIHILDNNVRAVLLYGSAIWKVINNIPSKLHVLRKRSLHQIIK